MYISVVWREREKDMNTQARNRSDNDFLVRTYLFLDMQGDNRYYKRDNREIRG